MTAFNAFNKMPNVYIQEIDVPGPIPGVGTSTVAIIGPARRGPIGEPTFLTNWTQFLNAFGATDAFGPYFPALAVYAPHAVRGFFDNGGATGYFVRVATAVRASLALNDRATPTARPVLTVRAKDEGVDGNAITVEVQDAGLVSAVAATRAAGGLTAASNRQATLAAAADAARFRPGDVVLLEEGANSERATVASVSGATLAFQANLANAYTGGTVRIADLAPGQKTIRLDATAGIEPGTSLRLTQGSTNETGVVQSVEATNGFVTLTAGLANTYTMAAADAAVTADSLEFTLIVTTPGSGPETFANLSMDPRHSRYVLAAVAGAASVDLALEDDPTPPPANRPAVVAATALAGGQDDDPTQLDVPDYTAALAALEKIDDVNVVCVPDRTDVTVQMLVVQHCEKMQDRFAVLDPPAGFGPDQIKTHRDQLASDRGHAALYYPRVWVTNPVGAGRVKVPPSGHLAGLYARTDDEKGVHKAPANEALRGVVGLEATLSDDEHGPLNEKSVNVIRAFPGRGIRVWGARTIATETQWRYVNVRRLLLFVEESIQEGTQFAVFQPNNLELWGQLKRQVTEFLTRVWRSGALVGAKPEEAFRVRIDDELNPPSTIALGQLIIEVRLAPTTPAEFVVFQIIQEPGRKIVNE
jgi:Bacteriophage tail sheath protein